MMSNDRDAVVLSILPRAGMRAMIRALLLLVAAAGCARTGNDRSDSVAATARAHATYTPATREVAITTVPLLVREQQTVLPFLKEDFAKGGVLDGKEVYGFSPSTITVVEGDTIHFTFFNPEDDEHSFVLRDLDVPLPPQRTTTATYVAKRAGVFPFVCSVPKHLPMMHGQLVVLARAAVSE
jgi:plastocyanin